jgi:hypothetical protein
MIQQWKCPIDWADRPRECPSIVEQVTTLHLISTLYQIHIVPVRPALNRLLLYIWSLHCTRFTLYQCDQPSTGYYSTSDLYIVPDSHCTSATSPQQVTTLHLISTLYQIHIVTVRPALNRLLLYIWSLHCTIFTLYQCDQPSTGYY